MPVQVRRKDGPIMPSSTMGALGPGSAGILLRQWRDLRGLSQLDLALEAGVSQKHVSFVERGRSRPSSQMVIDLAEALDVPLRERNTILLAAGHAPRYSVAALDTPSLARIDVALRRMLRQNEPYPAVVMDRHWNVMMANDAAPRFFGRFVDLAALPTPRNLLRLIFDPDGLRPFVVDWPRTSRMLLTRVRREALGGLIDAGTRELLDDLERRAGPDSRRTVPDHEHASPLIPLTFSKNDETWSYFSLVTTVGTPQTVAAQEFRLECMMPADEETERRHVASVSLRPDDEAAPP
ncbi:helix-turn-helix domain-containing protein [Methylobacterium symbioticum]|nr:helix-turn-helix domain-containing protein [Methylobacterium symbioticum]